KILLPLIIITILFASCEKNSGNGQITSETRQLESFEKVEVAGAYSVFIDHDAKSEVRIEAESNLIQYISTEVKNGVLHIDNSKNISPELPVTIFVKTADINSINLSGTGSIAIDTLIGDNVEVINSGSGIINSEIVGNVVNIDNSGSGLMTCNIVSEQLNYHSSGSGLVKFSGFSNTGNFEITGSGNIKSYGLIINELDVNISGSGNMEVNVSNSLNVIISGSGSVFYLGNPLIETNITGSGSIVNKN
ncbi:MAG: hypothetical protein DRQ89_12070, partial [Epsilonproteobacteria bacterium]